MGERDANGLQLGIIFGCILRDASQELDELLKTPEGVKKVRQMFELCDTFDGTDTLNVAYFIYDLLVSIASSVQYNMDIDGICQIMNNPSGGTPLQRYAKQHGYPGTKRDDCHDVQYTDLVKSLNHTSKGEFGSTYYIVTFNYVLYYYSRN